MPGITQDDDEDEKLLRRLRETYGMEAVDAAKSDLRKDPRVRLFLSGGDVDPRPSLTDMIKGPFVKKLTSLSTVFDLAVDPLQAQEIDPGFFIETLLDRCEEFGTTEKIMYDVVDAVTEHVEKLRGGEYGPLIQ